MHFSVGLIVTGNKSLSIEENRVLLEEVCKINSPFVVGFDFEQ